MKFLIAFLLLVGLFGTAKAVPQGSSAGGIPMSLFNVPGGVAPYNPNFEASTAASSRTLGVGDCGSNIPFTSSSSVVVTLPNLSTNCQLGLIQEGVGQVRLTTSGGAALTSRFNATTAQGSKIEIYNLGGGATWNLAGDASFFNFLGVTAPTLPPAPPTPTITYYVSPTGSDSNNGTSSATPWQTLAHVNALTGAAEIQAGSAVALQGGANFTGCLAFIQGTNVLSSTPTSGIQLITYGAGNATVTSNCAGTGSGTQGPKSAVIKFDGVNGVYVGPNIVANANNTGTQYGILVQDSVNTTGITNVTINGVTAEGANISTSATADVAADIAVLGYANNTSCSPINQVLIENSTAKGLSITGTDDTGILERGCATATSMNVTNVTNASNVVTDIGGRASGAYGGGSGNGIITNGVQYVDNKFNLVTAGGANTTTCGGPGGIWAYNSDNVNIEHNEVDSMGPTTPNASGCDWLAYDLDGGVTNSVIQYNHSYNNFGPAWEFFIGGGGRGVWSNNTIRYNISENDTAGNITSNTYAADYQEGIMFWGGGGGAVSGGVGTGAFAYNNTAVITTATNQSSCLVFNPGNSMPTNGLYANNLCELTGLSNGSSPIYLYGSGDNPVGTLFLSNSYYAASGTTNFNAGGFNGPSYGAYNSFSAWAAVAPGGEAGSVQSAPGFASTPSPAACTITAGAGPQSCPLQLSLGAGSAYKGAGTNLGNAPENIGVGLHDYYGNALPNATASGANIGAYGGN